MRPKLLVLLFAALASSAACQGSSSPTDAAADTAPADTAVDVPVDTGPPRCRSNAECAANPAGTVCDTTTGACVGCLASPTDTCTPSQHCDPVSRRCAAGCSRDEGCTEGTARRCDTLVNACVECVTNDHCMAGQLCRGGRCAAGCTAERACPTGQACCTGACVDTQTNVADCGGCGMTCRAPNGVPACAAGACTIATCTAPYADCDMMAANGCETNTQVSAAHCGACGTACPTPSNGAATCRAGACAVTCNTGFGDCDAMAANGCETDTRATAAHCGACGRACAPPNAAGACMDGACRVGACNAGFGDCDMDAANGCETSTAANVMHCGRCGNACPAAPNARPSCAAGTCGIVCNPGFGDCDGNAANGCETDTSTSATHCGACGMACAGTCAGGVCMGLTCPTGRGDCDGMASNGCETDTTTSATHCGACRRACTAGPNATAACAAGACGVTCATGYGDCDSNPVNGCEVETRVSPSHCGACGRACASGEVCQAGTCVAPCPGSQTRCGGACVSTETSNLHCGRCGNACPSGSTCAGATCRCPLSGDPIGGVQCGATCTDVLTNNANCGTCGNVCATGTTCVRGTCRCNIAGAPLGITCGAACVDPLSDARHCGRCDNACPTGQTCTTGICRCPADRTVCGGTCVDTQTNPDHCGTCGTVCGAGTACLAGACRTCPTGQTLCGRVCIDTRGDALHCGGCGMPCAPGLVCVASTCQSTIHNSVPFAGASATSGTCTYMSTGAYRYDNLGSMVWRDCVRAASRRGAMLWPQQYTTPQVGWYSHRLGSQAMTGIWSSYRSADISTAQACVVARDPRAARRDAPLSGVTTHDGQQWRFEDYGLRYYDECIQLASEAGAMIITPFTIGRTGADYWINSVHSCNTYEWIPSTGTTFTYESLSSNARSSRRNCMVGFVDN